MSAPKFTPGPWRKSVKSNFGNMIEARSGKKINDLDDGYRTVAMYQACEPTGLWTAKEENQAANGSLVAAAPDMFAALSEMVRFADWIETTQIQLPPTERATVEAARAALKLARGE